MSIIDITAIDDGCGSGTSSTIITYVDNVKDWSRSGTFQYRCSTSFLSYLESNYISRSKIDGNTIYLNNEQYWPEPSSNKTILYAGIISVIAIVAYSTFKNKNSNVLSQQNNLSQ